MDEVKPTSIVFFSEGFKEAEFLMSIRYPRTIADATHELNIKSWHVLRAFQLLNEEVGNKAYIEKIFSQHATDLFNSLNGQPGKGPYVLYFENYRISFCIEVLFFELKSFLDFFATKVIEKALNMNSGIHTFKSKGSGETCDPGAGFLEVLERNSPKESKAKAAAIIAIIKKHKLLWIDAVIKDRNKATHYGTLQAKITMNSGLLSPPITDFTFQIFFEESNLVEFSSTLSKNFIDFLKEILQEIVKE